MLIPFGLGLIHFGRPSGIGTNNQYDAAITLCLSWRGSVPSGELQWRKTWRFAWDWLPIRIYRDLTSPSRFVVEQWALRYFADGTVHNSSRWTGRDRGFIGFGGWRRNLITLRSNRRSLMHVYKTGAKERANPSHSLFVTPAAQLGPNMSKNDIPAEWLDPMTKQPKTFEVVFIHGCASVDEQLGEWMISTGNAQRTNIVRATGNMLGGLAAMIAGRS